MFDDVLGALLSPLGLALLGLCIGSFLNVVVHRLPLMLEREWWVSLAEQLSEPAAWARLTRNAQSPHPAVLAHAAQAVGDTIAQLPPMGLARPRSRCPACGHRLSWHENVPVLSWLRLKGRCSACGTRISARYPLIELATGTLFFGFGMHFGATAQAAIWCVAGALLLAMTMIDIDTQYLPDDLTLPLLGLGIVAAWMGWTGVSLADAALGAFWGYTSLWTINRTFKAVRGVEGMGHGDFKLLAALGALLGWKLLPAVVLLSSAVGALVGLLFIVFRKHDWARPLPFGPYLAGGGLAAAFFGGPLTALYFPTL
jgi:leader peptidase (prepilin peptidase) / N-methyltransferase